MISEAAISQSDEDDDLSDDTVEGEALMLSWLQWEPIRCV